jgi:hypothetical protein
MAGWGQARWEYCELACTDDKVQVRVFSARGNREKEYAAWDRANVFARLGTLGWELVNVAELSQGADEHLYYFKRHLPWWWIGKIPLHDYGK